MNAPPLQTRPAAPPLNPEQQAAVDHGDSPLLVIAGAGSGKTLTLAARVARLVRDGADPQRLLLLTFSRRAAREMQQRAGHLLHQALGLPATTALPQLPWAGTFHSVGARLLRELALRIGLPEHFTVLDRADAEDLMGWVRQERGLAESHARFPLKGTCLAIHSRQVNSQAPLAEVLAAGFPWCAPCETELAGLFQAYVQTKLDQHVLDYDDLLLWWAAALEEPALAAGLRQRFDHVLVDEYPDTNRLQARILAGMKPDGRGLTVVGDDAQAIYSFRAAEVRNILDFPQGFSPPARVLTLTRNYRSTAPILAAANAVIALAPQRYAKELRSQQPGGALPELVNVQDEADQARQVATQVLARREQGLRLKQQAVLFRTGHHSAALELELVRRRIPFVKYGGLRFLEAAHIKDVLAVLRWAQNPRGRLAAFRVAQLLPGIGPGHARRLVDAVAGAAEPWQALRQVQPPAAARDDFDALRRLLLQLAEHPPAWPAELARVIDWYTPHLHRLHEHPVPREVDLGQLAALAGQQRNRERFLTELALDPPEATSDEAGPPLLDEDYLILSTIHSAKGQEWQAVHVLHVVDGCLPGDLATASPAQLEEERRLLYVAMTRARQHLSLMVPQRFYVTQQTRHGDRHLYGARSRFLPTSMMGLFDHPGEQGLVSAPGVAAPQAVVDLRERLRRLAAPAGREPTDPASKA